jgi:hypothetical protein
MYLHYPADHFVQAMATISFVLDMAFLAAYLKLRKTRTAAVTGRPG